MTQPLGNSLGGQTGEPALSGSPVGRLVADAGQISKARRFFEHAKKAADTRNYDYAIRLYVDGLALWPDAIEEGMKMLRVVATARRLDGGKPLGFLASRKYPLGGKDLLRSLKNALYLFGMDPANLGHMEAILEIATKAKCDRMVEWIAPVLADAYNSAKKLSAGRYAASCAAMDAAAELAMAVGEGEGARRILEANISTTQTWSRHYPESPEAAKARSNASSKLTIVKGRFDKATGFQDSLKDGDAQQDLRDQDRMVQTFDRQQQLVARARADWEANPSIAAKLIHLIDLMTRTEHDESENEAIALLEKQYSASDDYAFKQKADEIRMRQLSRYRRKLQAEAKADPQNAEKIQAVARHVAKQGETEVGIYRDRLEHYPTDMKLRFELGQRLFVLKRFDEAIPLFQTAQADGRCRGESRLYLGRCFHEKKFPDQASATLRQALAELDSTSGRLVMELHYWLGRSLEAANNLPEARDVYGHLIQLDYNYRDARSRLERLVGGGAS